MTKSVTVEELAANLRDYLAEVQDGTTVEVVVDGHAVVSISPTIYYPKSLRRLGEIDPGPRPPNLKTDPVKILMEDRHGSGEDHE